MSGARDPKNQPRPEHSVRIRVRSTQSRVGAQYALQVRMRSQLSAKSGTQPSSAYDCARRSGCSRPAATRIARKPWSRITTGTANSKQQSKSNSSTRNLTEGHGRPRREASRQAPWPQRPKRRNFTGRFPSLMLLLDAVRILRGLPWPSVAFRRFRVELLPLLLILP